MGKSTSAKKKKRKSGSGGQLEYHERLRRHNISVGVKRSHACGRRRPPIHGKLTPTNYDAAGYTLNSESEREVQREEELLLSEEEEEEEDLEEDIETLMDYEAHYLQPIPYDANFDEEDETTDLDEEFNLFHYDGPPLVRAGDFDNYGNWKGVLPVDAHGCTVHDVESFLSPQSEYNFRFAERIAREWRLLGGMNRVAPFDSKHSVYPQHQTILTKELFAEKAKQYLNATKQTDLVANRTLEFWESMFGSFVNFPFSSQIKGKGNLLAQMKQYCHMTGKTFRFSQCPQDGCCAFVGDNEPKKKCPVCSAYRFHPCLEDTCRRTMQLQGRGDESYCSHSNRSPCKVIHYNSISFIINSLLHQNEFLSVLNYKYCAPTNSDGERREAYRYCDIMDGETAKENMKQMHANYLSRNDHQVSQQPVEISLLLSYFYDGVQVNHKKVHNFWPLMMQILNLPPTFRCRLGVGIFTLGLFTGKSGSKSEDFLLRECFAQELHMLEKGYHITVNDKKYFIQARIIAHQLDTKAFEKVMHCQASSNALIGCPLCYSCCGRTHSGYGKGTYYVGHRMNLVKEHVLRTLGSGREQCSFNSGDVHILPQTTQARQAEKNAFEAFRSPPSTYRYPRLDTEPKCADITSLLTEGCPYVGPGKRYPDASYIDSVYYEGVWYHDTVKYNRKVFLKFLYYENCELREGIPHVRKSTNWYLQNGQKAIEESDASGRPVSISGVKGLWFAKSLKYVRYEDTYWDSMHVLKNVYVSAISSLIGKKMESDARQEFTKYCKMKYMFPSVHQSKGLPAWRLDAHEQRVADAFLNAMLIPSGYDSSIQAKEIFEHPAQTNCHAAKALLMVLLPYLLDRTKLEGTYKVFFWMLAEDLVDMYRPNVAAADVSKIHDRMLETVCIHDGLFPPFECTFSWHQLIDLPNMIYQLSTLLGWTGFWGEKCLGILKRLKTIGGSAQDYTIMDRMKRLEEAQMLAAYSSASEHDTKQTHNLRKELFDEAFMSRSLTGQYMYTFHRVVLRPNSLQVAYRNYFKKGTQSINSFETESILQMLMGEIKRTAGNRKVALENSALYRIGVAFAEFHVAQVENEFSTFYEFLQYLNFLMENNCQVKDSVVVNYIKYKVPASGLSVVDGELLWGDVCSTCTAFFALHESIASTMHRRCSVFGVSFTSRGYNCREEHRIHKDENGYVLTSIKKCNRLALVWNNKSNYSSWCKYKQRLSGNTLESKTRYAQINSFHRLSYEKDPFLNGLLVASITTRVHQFEIDATTDVTNSYATISTNQQQESLYSKCPRFICCKDIVPTPIAVVGIVVDEGDQPKPWLSTQANTVNIRDYAVCPSEGVSFLHLIDLFPFNTKVEWDKSMNNYYSS